MKQNLRARTVFWTSTMILFAFNIVGILLFRKHIRVSVNSFVATVIFVVLLIRGICAYAGKNDGYLLLKKYVWEKFNKYHWATREELTDFYIKATVYFAVLPFYLPLAVFSSKSEHSLWCCLLLAVPQCVILGIEFRKRVALSKEAKIQEAILEQEKEEQERREELGYWKSSQDR